MKPNKTGLARVKFLALKETIESELERGFCRADIFRNHQESLGMSYSQFARLVSSQILNPEKPKKPVVETQKLTSERTQDDREDRPDDKPKRQGFQRRPINFNPTPDRAKVRDWLSPAQKPEEGEGQ